MVTCEVNGCENKTTCKSQEQIERESNGLKISFYRFPRSEDRRNLWIEALQKEENWIPDEKSVICSDHFDPECFERSDVHAYIAKQAVPTIFPNDPKPDVKNFEFIPFSDPNEPLRINDKLDIEDPLNVPQIKLEPRDEVLTESMETQTVIVKEEQTDDIEESPLVNQIIFPIETNNMDVDPNLSNVTCDTSAQTDGSVQMDELLPDSRLEDEEMRKTKAYRKQIKTLQQQIRRQDKLINSLEQQISAIRGKSD